MFIIEKTDYTNNRYSILNYNLKELQSSHNDSDKRLMLLSLIQKYSSQTVEPQLKWRHDKDFIANRFWSAVLQNFKYC